jgi:putative SOS response-associated peptidase YedK
MCGRYVADKAIEGMIAQLNALNVVPVAPRYNVAPTQPVLAIWEEANRREVHFARWGLVPRWVKDPRQFSLLVNARAETISEKPAFRDALKHGRCILPATGYYEWRTGPDKRKQPYYITFANDEPMALAGLYTTWSGPEGEEVDTVATITVPANEQLSVIHDRMPVILRGAEIEQWLNVRGVRADEAGQLALPLEDGALKFHAVSTRVNTAQFDDEGLIAPVTVEKPEPPKGEGGPGQLSLF